MQDVEKGMGINMIEDINVTPNILVIDDVSGNLAILSEIIRRTGYIARPVASAKQAVSAIEELIPNLILLDISMPDIDGFVFCSMLKKNIWTRDIPVIFISAHDTVEDKIKGFRLGAVDYITKPFEAEEVTLRINTHIRMYKMQQQLEVYKKKLYKTINDQMSKYYEEQKNVTHALKVLMSQKYSFEEPHMDRVGKNSKLLAMSLQLTPSFKDQISASFIETIELAAPLHDIGKIAIPDSILLKKGKLSEEENEIIRTHSQIGADTLEEISTRNVRNEFLKMAINISKYHHEHWNGTGYPLGLKGREIPLCARIVAIIDVYDSLSNETVYKEAYSHERSMEIIRDGADILFDPEIVAVFMKIQNRLL